ncbi:hypothetical protein ACFL41_00155 [Gemmatimonadota bacterium]
MTVQIISQIDSPFSLTISKCINITTNIPVQSLNIPIGAEREVVQTLVELQSQRSNCILIGNTRDLLWEALVIITLNQATTLLAPPRSCTRGLIEFLPEALQPEIIPCPIDMMELVSTIKSTNHVYDLLIKDDDRTTAAAIAAAAYILKTNWHHLKYGLMLNEQTHIQFLEYVNQLNRIPLLKKLLGETGATILECGRNLEFPHVTTIEGNREHQEWLHDNNILFSALDSLHRNLHGDE